MLLTMEKFVSRFFPLLIPVSILLGVLGSKELAPLEVLVPWLFAAMTFLSSLRCSFADFPRFLKHPGPVIAGLTVIHLLTPLFAVAVALLTTGLSDNLGHGVILETLVPMGVTAVVWAGIVDGDVPLALSTAAVDTLVTPLVLPLSALLIMGQSVEVDSFGLFLGLAKILLLPSFLAITINQLSAGTLGQRLQIPGSLISKLGLCLVVAISVGTAWPTLQSTPANYPLLLVVMALVSGAGFIFGFLAGKVGGYSEPIARTLVYTGGMRNTVLGTVLALNYFHPVATVPIVLTMLFQQPFAALGRYLLQRSVVTENRSTQPFSELR